MTIEKLQKVATAHVDPGVKAKWLRWWNSPKDVKEKNKFPSSLPLREKILENWLNKASFWAQVFSPPFWFARDLGTLSIPIVSSKSEFLF